MKTVGIYLSICFLVLLGAIGGIAYLQRAGRASKYAGQKKDSQLLKGCALQIALTLPFTVLIGYAIDIFTPIFAARFNPQAAGVLLYVILQFACGGFNAISEKIYAVINREKQ